MRKQHAAERGSFVMIGTKVHQSEKQKLSVIAERFDMSIYALLQSLLLFLLRSFDQPSALSDEHRTMLHAFLNTMAANEDVHNLLKAPGKIPQHIDQAVLFVRFGKDNHAQLLAVGKDEKGQATEHYNTDTILTDLLKAYDPNILHALEKERDRRGHFSLCHTLHDIVLQRAVQSTDQMHEEIAELFSDVRITSGESLNDDVFYVRKHYKGQNIISDKRPILAEL